MKLSQRHWKFLIIENGLGPTFSNILINGGITWLVFRQSESVNPQSATMDILSTSFLLPFITVFLAFAVTRKQIKTNKLEKREIPTENHHSKFYTSTVFRAFLLGLLGLLFFGVPTYLCVSWVTKGECPIMQYVYFKGIWGGVLALLISPLAGWWALNKYSAK